MSESPLHDRESPESLKAMKEELLAALIEEGNGFYSWNPGDPETEAYFAQLEADFSLLDGLNSQEIDSQAEAFLAQLHQSWESGETEGEQP